MSQTTHTFNLRDFMSAGLNRIGKVGAGVFGRLDRAQDRLGRQADNLTSKFGQLVAAAGLAELGRNVVQTTAEFEKMGAVLANTLGSESRAQAALGNIKDFAATTPFQVNELTDAYVKLANRGFTPTISEMGKLGDLAASTGKTFDDLTEAMLDAETGEFERLKEFGIRASKQGDQVKFAFKGVETQVAFTEDAIRGYLLSLGQVEGVSGSMNAISGTLAGQLSNLQDRVTSLFYTMGQELRPVIGAVVGSLGDMLDRAEMAVKWLGQNREVALGLATGLGVVAGALGVVKIATIAWNLALAANPISLVILGIGALVGALVYAWNKFDGFRGTVMGLWEAFKSVFMNIGQLASEVLGGVGNLLMGVFTLDADRIKAGAKQLGKAFSDYGGKVMDAYAEGDQRGRGNFQDRLALPGVTGAPNLLAMGDENVTDNSRPPGPGADPTRDLTNAVSSASGGARSARNITVNIERVTGIEQVVSNNIRGAVEDADEALRRAIFRIMRDVQVIEG